MNESEGLAGVDPSEGIPDWFVTRVGWITIGWAMVEYGLDYSIRDIFRHHNGGSIQSKPPASLGAKVAFLRKAFNQIPSLASIAPIGHAFLDEVNDLKHQRHDIVHGILGGPDGDAYRQMRFRYEDAGHITERYSYRLTDLALLGRLISSLAERLSFFVDLITDDQSEEALREIAIGKPAVSIPKKKLLLDPGD